MKKLLLLIILCVSNVVISADIKTYNPDTSWFTSKQSSMLSIANNLSLRHYNKKLNDKEFVSELLKCSLKNNFWCSGRLGDWLLEKNEYSDAFYLLTQANDNLHDSFSFSLGRMYLEGVGVLQNEEKALLYFKKAAKAEVDLSRVRKYAAYNVGVIYSQKELKKKNNNITNITKAYAWFKVSKALGYDAEIKVNEVLKEYLASHKGLLKADKLATQICSTIPNCH
ncbi:TPA: sel1 repeat family protein [Legionella pneumophila]|uniref:Sel1 repeat protein n=1 Tax=Legionella waltersii TaxID=66969 RepID=A0A0W1ANS6_9GAMM|nr:tetratricopeptide repeat protein [Legionella waltersii]HAU3629688.1 sel1 repeat family protein [Legionella pneumophila]KTD82983.1 Sel1 repeat protein [Legionella waltersii]SNV07470.1 Sel1 repeat [Legionella waltersii]HAU3648720.1 sel1 repeat family protein [Legionella pneumophila]HAU3655105.1 sel1 repeat family protein [Legionella pneumophila]